MLNLILVKKILIKENNLFLIIKGAVTFFVNIIKDFGIVIRIIVIARTKIILRTVVKIKTIRTIVEKLNIGNLNNNTNIFINIK